jgi:uncharacterized protein YjdB
MSFSTGGIHGAADANNRSYVTHGDKSCTTTNEINCNQYKPSISVFICDTESIKDSKIHKGDPDEAEHRVNSETYTLSAGAVGMMLYTYMEISQREDLSAGFPYFYWVSHCHCI